MSDPYGRMVDNPAYDDEPKHVKLEAEIERLWRENERLRKLHKGSDSQFLSALMSTEEALMDAKRTLTAVREWAETIEGSGHHPQLREAARQVFLILGRSDTDE